MLKITKERIEEILSKFPGKTIAVVGDVMLDRYFWGSVSRISPEAPVPVIDLEKESFHLGGAANVASNLKSLGINSLLCGVIGNDGSGKIFIDISKKGGINPSGLFVDNNRPTTVKTRIIGNNQQLIRLDREIRNSISSVGAKYILEALRNNGEIAGIIFEDYNKGTLTSELIKDITKFATDNYIPVFVDPKKDNFFNFNKATVFKPNKKEVQDALDISINSKEKIISAGKILLDKLQCQNLLLTLGSEGMMLFESNGDISSVPTHARHVADVSGAGDTAIATLAAAFIAGASIREAASIANHAAGVVCEEPGIVSINCENLLKSVLYK